VTFRAKASIPIVASVLAFWCALVPAAGQRGGGKGAPKVSRPVEPAPRWPDGHVNLGSSPGHKGYWELRPGFGPRPTNVPFLPWAKEVYAYREKSQVAARPPYIDCKANPGPEFLLAPGFDIVEAPELKSVFIMNIAGPHSWRVIHMDRSDHLKDLRPTYLGDSIGKWDGDTLVVDTVGFNDKTWVDRAGHPHSTDMHLVERIHRVDKNTLTDDISIEDPKAYTKPWGGQITFQLHPTWNITEMVCEDNVNFDDFLKNEAKPKK
jgi:hypothetical protein